MLPLSAGNPSSPHELSVVVDLGGCLPLDAAVESQFVVPSPVQPQLPAVVGEGPEADARDELLGQGLVVPLELPPPAGVVGPSVDHADALPPAEPLEVPGEEAGPVVHVECLRPPPVPEGPPQRVHRLHGPVVEVGPGRHEVPGAVVEDREGVDSPHPGDPELVVVHLPEAVDVAALEPAVGLRLLQDTDHQAVPLQDAVDRAPGHLDPGPPEVGVDPLPAPHRVPPPHPEDAVLDPPRRLAGAPVRPAGPVPEARHALLAVPPGPLPQGPRGDPEEPTKVRCPRAPLEVLSHRPQPELHVRLDHGLAPPRRQDVLAPLAAACPGTLHVTRPLAVEAREP